MENKTIAEEATGIKQQGELTYWSKGKKISLTQAKKLLFENGEVAIPQAGAGNYDEVFLMLGFSKVQVMFDSSSAGDWQFAVKDKTGWRLASQENRYPYHGFNYWIDIEGGCGFDKLEDLMNLL